LLYWNIGKKINQEILQDKRAEYGKQIVATLWQQLTWSHFKILIPIEDPIKREFYIEMCKLEKWSVRTFCERIKSMLYERTAISKKPEETIKNELQQLRDAEQVTSDLVFRDPYFLDFLDLKDTYSEKDLESAIIAELQRFIIELGSNFAFLARQKRITIDNRDYYIDLLFYHRRLKSLIAIDLKIGEFDAAYKGEMELYLGYLEKYENIEGADYFTVLPAKKILMDRLHKAIKIAQNNFSQH